MAEKTIVVLISGSGTNLQALIDAKLPASIVHVISSSAKAYGLERAKRANIPSTVHNLARYTRGVPKEDVDARAALRAQFNRDLADIIVRIKPSLVVCAGWMLILSPEFLEALERAHIAIINLHPALPGAFPGINAIERAWEAGQRGETKKGGVMIHYVIKDVDEGKPLLVREIELRKDESLADYVARVHDVEHKAIVEGTTLALKHLDG